MCHCSVAPDTNPSSRSIDTLVISIANTNTIASIIISTSDDWNENIEKAKTKIKEQIKRK